MDYRLDIAHASMLCTKIQNRKEVDACEVVVCTALEEESGKVWANKHNISYVRSASEMAGHVDAVMIPASSHPELHLSLFESCISLGVPVFIDKPLAQDMESACRIFELAQENNITVSSSSALRFAAEVQEVLKENLSLDFVQTWGGYSQRFDEFLIHPMELAITLMGPDFHSVTRVSRGNNHHFTLNYPEGRQADVFFSAAEQPYEFAVCSQNSWKHYTLQSGFFDHLITSLLEAFRTNTPLVPSSQTLAVLKAMETTE